MANSSAAIGFLNTPISPAYPSALTLVQFIQTMLVGLSALPGPLVRPKWQPEMPKEPADIFTNWLAYGISSGTPDANAYVGMDANEVTTLQRHETLEVQCSFYGPAGFDNAGLVRDGFQLQQNLEALTSAKMGFVGVGQSLHVPDMINGRWVDRYEMTIMLRRLVQRTYPILSIVSANGTVLAANGNVPFIQDFTTEAKVLP